MSDFFSARTLWHTFVINFGLLLVVSILMSIFWNPQPVLPAPAVNFMTLKGEKIELKKWRGKPVLVTFWATDCPSCVQEVEDFRGLYQQFHPKGLEIIAVAMAYDPPNHVVEMTRAKQIPYSVALDLRGDIARAFNNVSVTPTTFLINPAGQIVFSKVGLFNFKTMQDKIQQLIGVV